MIVVCVRIILVPEPMRVGVVVVIKRNLIG
jgi:hypothetical protein